MVAVVNQTPRKVSSINPLRLDPSKTATLRRSFVAEMGRRFGNLKNAVYALIADEDAFGLKERKRLTFNKRFEFLTSDEKLKSFNKWFADQVKKDILQVDHEGKPWTSKYVDSAYKKGRTNAFLDAHKEDYSKNPAWLAGTKDQFLRQAFMQPETVSKLRLLGTRDFQQLNGITADMSAKLSRRLALGLAAGENPVTIARSISKTIDGITRKRALVLARTEIIHAHAEGQLDTFEDLGIDELHLNAEWGTAGDTRVCPRCNAMSGQIFSVKKARGLIPLHPNCRCSWRPAVGKKPTKLGKKQYKALKDKFPETASPAVKKGPQVSVDAAVIKGGILKGQSPAGLIRWMGSQGWSADDARKVVKELDLGVKENTIKTQIYAGKKWADTAGAKSTHGPPPSLTADQVSYLTTAKTGGAVTPPPVIPKATKPAPAVAPPADVAAPSFAETKIKELAGKFAKEFNLELKVDTSTVNDEAFLTDAYLTAKSINKQMDHMKMEFATIADYISDPKNKKMKQWLSLVPGKDIEFVTDDGVKIKVQGLHYGSQGTKIATQIPGLSNYDAAPQLGSFAVSADSGTLFRHEYGHQIWYSHFKNDTRLEFSKQFKHYIGEEGKKNVSVYGATNIRELWAESFAAYTSPLYKPGMLPEDIEAFMAEALTGKKKAVQVTTKAAEGATALSGAGWEGSSYSVVSSNIGGSTGAKLVEITKADGSKLRAVMKSYSGNEEQVRNEWLANTLYKNFGQDVPETWKAMADGKEVLLTKYEPNLSNLSSLDGSAYGVASKSAKGKPFEKAAKKLQKGFVVDSWLANWDVIGLNMDNVGVSPTGIPLRIDNGGALLFRAQGGLKGAAFGPNVTELQTLRDKLKNKSGYMVFDTVTNKDIVDQIDKFEESYQKIGGEKGLNAIIQQAGFDEATKKKLIQTLVDRRSSLLYQQSEMKEVLAKQAKQAEEYKKWKSSNDGWLLPPAPPATESYSNYKDLYKASEKAISSLTVRDQGAVGYFTGGGYSELVGFAVDAVKEPERLNDYGQSKIKELDTALGKLPGYKGWSARGLASHDPKEWENWKNGTWARIEFAAYSSTSVAPGAEFTSGQNGILFLIKNKGVAGAYVEPYSSHRHEKELLLKRGARFRVVGYAESDKPVSPKNHYRMLLIEEITPDTKVPENQPAPKQYDAEELWGMYKKEAFNALVPAVKY